MEYPEILEVLAPCGLSCGGCVAFQGGRIQQQARSLEALLGDNFGTYAQRFAGMNPVFNNYGAFKALLEFLAAGSCGGCRKEGCLFQACGVQGCVKDRGVDFCFQCSEFPCDNHGMPPLLAERWRKNNAHIQAVGVEAYFAKIKDRPRYP